MIWLQLWADMRAEGLIPDADTTATFPEKGADISALGGGKGSDGLDREQSARGLLGCDDCQTRRDNPPGGERNAFVIQMSQYLAINNFSVN